MTRIHKTKRGLRCPRCQARLPQALLVSGRAQRPKAGQFSVCDTCLEPLVFTGTLGLRLPDALELERAPRAMWEAIECVRAARARAATN